MRRIPLARVAAFRPFPQFLAAGGSDVERHLISMGISPESLASEESLVPLRQACEFVVRAGRKEGIDRIGLEVGSRTAMSGLGLFGTILCQSLTLHDLIQNLIRWIPAVDSGARVWLEAVDGVGCVRLCLRHEVDIGRVSADEFGLLLLIDAVRMALGPEWRPRRVSLDAASGGGVGDYEALSDAAMDRDVDYVGFEIPREGLGRPVISPVMKRGVAPVAGDALRATAPSEDAVESVSQAIRASFGGRPPTVERAAEMAGTSVRSFQRRLGTEGLVYSALIDRVRYEEARGLLEKREVSLADISVHLGYSEPANFSHAFRRWTGFSATEYRRLKASQGG